MNLRQYVVIASALGSVIVLTLPAATSRADEASDAPVTAPDHVTVRGGSFTLANVLKNDSDPNGDDLEICRVEVPEGVPIGDGGGVVFASSADDDYPDQLGVQSTRYGAGTYQITYYACDFDYLTPATVTVTVKRTRPVRAHVVKGHPGQVRFINPDDRSVDVTYYDLRTARDSSFSLRQKSSRVIRTDSRRIQWFAYPVRAPGDAGEGRVSHIQAH